MLRNHCRKEDLVCVPLRFLMGLSEAHGPLIFLYHSHLSFWPSLFFYLQETLFVASKKVRLRQVSGYSRGQGFIVDQIKSCISLRPQLSPCFSHHHFPPLLPPFCLGNSFGGMDGIKSSLISVLSHYSSLSRNANG